jgi:hypothetical protein
MASGSAHIPPLAPGAVECCAGGGGGLLGPSGAVALPGSDTATTVARTTGESMDMGRLVVASGGAGGGVGGTGISGVSGIFREFPSAARNVCAASGATCQALSAISQQSL